MTAGETARNTADRTPVVLSVIVPNYNHAEHVSAALTAILAQRRLPDEILLIDDGSTDHSRSLIEQWAAREPRIRAIFNPVNLGAIATINDGIRAARGDYVCLLSADDVSGPEFFLIALDELERHPEAALFCAEVDVYEVDRPDRPRGMRPVIRPSHRRRAFTPAEARRLLRYNDNFVVPLATVFRRGAILAEGGLDPRLGTMADGFLSRYLALKYGFCFAPQVVVTWKVRREGLSRATTRAPASVLALRAETRPRIAGDPVFPPGYAALFERRWQFSTCRLALTERPPDWNFLFMVGPDSRIDRALFAFMRRLPERWGALAGLVYLTARLRPYSLLAMADTSLRRRWARQRR